MSQYSFLQYLPLFTAGVWFSLCFYQVYRDRYRTWTEAFFLAHCFFVGAYALSDTYFFNAPTESQAAVAGLASFTSFTFAATFFFLFAVVFYKRMHRMLLLAFLPSLALVPFLWTYLVDGIIGLEPVPGTSPTQYTGPPWVGRWDPLWFTLWVLVILAYALAGALFLLLTYREIARQTTRLRRHMLGLLLSAILAVVLGTATNTLRGLLHLPIPPLFSTTLVVPGIVSFVTLSPFTTERFSTAVRRWKARRYDVKAVFLTYADGTLVGSRTAPGEKMVDQDLFGATLDVIQNFMRTSFPVLRGRWLQSIRHGEYTLVIERGRHTYLTVVLQGEENDQLRRYMRDLLLRYEAENRQVFEDWRGIPTEALGTEEVLGALFEGG